LEGSIISQNKVDVEDEVVLVSGVRTAIGNFGGSLKDISAVKLGALVIKEVLKRIKVKPKSSKKLLTYTPNVLQGEGSIALEKQYYDWDETFEELQVDEVIMGNVLQGGQGQNTARQATIYAGLPKEVNAFTVNKVCASGLKAITLGVNEIRCGEADVIIAGGMENMSCAPYLLPYARWGYRLNIDSKGDLLDLMVYDGLWEIFYGYHMGVTAENLAQRMHISREEQDKVGVLSNQRARKATEDGLFNDEIVPITIPQRKGEPIVFSIDERPRDTSIEKMAKLPPVFAKDGTVTAGNASGIADAAAAVVLMSRAKAKEMSIKPLATITSYASGAVDPAYMGLGPVPAVEKVLDRADMTCEDIDLIELNEAFAAQVIACMRELNLRLDTTNIHGGSIALGHPIGCTGARQTVSLLHAMNQNNGEHGLVTMCIGGGQGMAMLLKRET
jgi:acetyl-CoA C-acetyltransferase